MYALRASEAGVVLERVRGNRARRCTAAGWGGAGAAWLPAAHAELFLSTAQAKFSKCQLAIGVRVLAAQAKCAREHEEKKRSPLCGLRWNVASMHGSIKAGLW